MSFILPDEYIILYDFPTMTPDNLKRIREVGIKTAFKVIFWDNIETAPGIYAWSELDRWVERMRLADMKSLMRCHDRAPAFFPDDWYMRSMDGTLWRNLYGYGGDNPYVDRRTELSPWCAEAMAAERAFMRLCQERYASADVQLFASGTHGGEAILPGMIATYCDEHALASFREYAHKTFRGNLDEFNLANNVGVESWAEIMPSDLPTYQSMAFAPTTVSWLSGDLWTVVKERQDVFPEIWLSLVERNIPFGESYECGPRTGNWLMKDFCDYLPDELHKDLNVLLFQVNRPNGNQGSLNNVRDCLDKTWIGSEYCEGLYKYTAGSIAAGLRGFITGAVRPEHGMRFEDWMLEAFKWSLAQWKAARL